ncbi:MAG: sulfatase-like hydrolase/transferase [Planctomycetaceae bacterium]
MIENQDRNVGRVLDKLEEHGLTDDTIVFYFSDNGPNSFRWTGGMKGRKGSTDEGGVAVWATCVGPALSHQGIPSARSVGQSIYSPH